MKITFVSPSFPPEVCGVGSYTAKLAEALAGNNIETNVLTSTNTSFHPLRIGTVYNQLKKDRPDVLHVQFPTKERLSALEALLLFKVAKSLGIKTSITIHEHEPFYSKKSQLRNKLLASSADVVIVNNLQSHELFKKQKVKSIIIHNGPTIDRTSAYPDRKDGTVLTFFGFVAPHKRILETLSSIKRSSVDDSVSIRIIGKYDTSDSYHLLVEKQLGPKDEWLSGLDDAEASREIVKSTLAILPFEHGVSEKNSTVISMFHLGVPVMTNGPIPIVLRDAVLDGGSDFGAELKKALGNQELIYTIKTSASKLIKEDFNWVACSSQHVQAYEGLVSL